MHFEPNFFSLAIISLIAFLTPILISKIKFIAIPEVIVLIFAGFVIGKSGFNLIPNSEAVTFLSTLSFAYLMFLSGYEVDFSLFKKSQSNDKASSNPLKSAILITLITLTLSLIISSALLYYGIVKSILLSALIFSTTSLGIVVPVLKEKGVIDSPFGQSILVSALFADFSTLFFLPLVMFLVKGNMDYSILYSCFLFIFFVLLYFVLNAMKKLCLNKNLLRVTQLKVRIVLMVLFMFAILAEMIGIEVIVGAFMAGALFSLVLKKYTPSSLDTEKKNEGEAIIDSNNSCSFEKIEILNEKLDAIGFGFLIPIFFIMIGVNFEIRSIFSMETLIILPIFLGIAYTVKLIPCISVLKREFGFKKSLSAGFLLSSRLSLIIALAKIALKSSVITNTMYSTLVIVAILTCILSPIISIKIWDKHNENSIPKES